MDKLLNRKLNLCGNVGTKYAAWYMATKLASTFTFVKVTQYYVWASEGTYSSGQKISHSVCVLYYLVFKCLEENVNYV